MDEWRSGGERGEEVCGLFLPNLDCTSSPFDHDAVILYEAVSIIYRAPDDTSCSVYYVLGRTNCKHAMHHIVEYCPVSGVVRDSTQLHFFTYLFYTLKPGYSKAQL